MTTYKVQQAQYIYALKHKTKTRFTPWQWTGRGAMVRLLHRVVQLSEEENENTKKHSKEKKVKESKTKEKLW